MYRVTGTIIAWLPELAAARIATRDFPFQMDIFTVCLCAAPMA